MNFSVLATLANINLQTKWSHAFAFSFLKVLFPSSHFRLATLLSIIFLIEQSLHSICPIYFAFLLFVVPNIVLLSIILLSTVFLSTFLQFVKFPLSMLLLPQTWKIYLSSTMVYKRLTESNKLKLARTRLQVVHVGSCIELFWVVPCDNALHLQQHSTYFSIIPRIL